MNHIAQAPVGQLDWVLVLAPYRKDATYMESLLVEHGLIVGRWMDGQDLAEWLGKAPGAIIATHEALSPEVVKTIGNYLERQPLWSELPIIVLLDRAAQHARIRAELGAAWSRSRHLFYQRPVAALELVSGIQAALLARLRQRDVRDHIERETALRLELNHRVKNILASVSSMFQMTRRGAQSVDDLAEDFGGRLAALGDVHSAVFQAGGEAISLTSIVDLTVSPYRSGGVSRINAYGPDVTVSRDAATTLALCLHELATNAIKYGALSQPDGKVDLHWTVTSGAEPIVAIEWVESDGPPVSEPSSAGYGTKYMRSALAGLFGEAPSATYPTSGLRYAVRGPLSRLMPVSLGKGKGAL
jgi:two-component sensor histidine kinase